MVDRELGLGGFLLRERERETERQREQRDRERETERERKKERGGEQTQIKKPQISR